MIALKLCWRACPGLMASVALFLPSALTAATTPVSVGDNFFSPASVTINVNDAVQWTWAGANSHSTTSSGALWDSGIHGNGFTFSRTFTSSGSFPYVCSVHAFQTGSVTVQSANTPPTVTITNPPNNSVFHAPAAFTIRASASDTGGSITNVQFRQFSTVLTNRTTTPYAAVITNLVAGAYTFSAVASDNGGLRATNSISITVNALPTVALTNPTNGATFAAPWAGTLQASVADSDGTVTNVTFFDGATPLGAVANPPQNASFPVSNLGAGPHTLSAVVRDNRGATNTSASITVNVVTPVAIQLSGVQRPSPTSFQFDYSANVGLSYVIARSVDLGAWLPLRTNVAANNPVTFLDTNAPVTRAFYRVQRLPNL